MNHSTKFASFLALVMMLFQNFQTPPVNPQDTAATKYTYLPLLVYIPDITALPPGTSGGLTIFKPNIIAVSGSDSELVNPMRGMHEWRNNEEVPLPDSSPDAYQRYFWYDPDHPSESLETSRGVYNFSKLEADIAAAAAKGKKFAFRIRAMASDTSGKRYIPDYMSDCGWSYRGTFIPDWNKSCFLDRASSLMNALGDRYDKDARIAWVDLGLYGRWGEWAMDEDVYNSAPSGVSAASDASLVRIVDLQLNAFPNARKVMMAKTNAAAVARALSSSNKVGWRVDCLGKPGYFDFETNSRYRESWPHMRDRWKTAPVIVEFCNGGVDESYNTAIDQARDWHIATVGNGNFDSWSSKSSQQKNKLLQLARTTGYRFQIKALGVPSTWSPGSNISIVTAWQNVGIAPHYERVQVKFKLYDPNSRRYVWEDASSFDLHTLLPTGDKHEIVDDIVHLPGDLRNGTYQLRLVVIDPNGYRKPLRLANQGRQSDGSYLLGNVSVR